MEKTVITVLLAEYKTDHYVTVAVFPNQEAGQEYLDSIFELHLISGRVTTENFVNTGIFNTDAIGIKYSLYAVNHYPIKDCPRPGGTTFTCARSLILIPFESGQPIYRGDGATM